MEQVILSTFPGAICSALGEVQPLGPGGYPR